MPIYIPTREVDGENKITIYVLYAILRASLSLTRGLFFQVQSMRATIKEVVCAVVAGMYIL